jgi:hypothetical protein
VDSAKARTYKFEEASLSERKAYNHFGQRHKQRVGTHVPFVQWRQWSDFYETTNETPIMVDGIRLFYPDRSGKYIYVFEPGVGLITVINKV